MNSQQYTGLQAAMPQGSGARIAVSKGEGTVFDPTAAVKKITEVGTAVAKHIQSTQDANRQIDFTLMQSENAIKDKEAQQVLATLDPETRKVTLPDGTQQDHKAYVDTYSQAKNQTVNDFRGKYNYGHYSNDKIDVATRSVLETSAVENTFIKQQNELQIAEGRTVNATKKLISSMDIPADQALTTTENALKATQMPYVKQRQVLSDSAKTRVTLELSNQSLQTSKDLGELVKKYGDNKDTYDKKVQEYYSSEAYQHRVNSLLALQTYLENNPDLAGTAAETKVKIQQQEVNTLNEANVAVQGDKAALHASLLTQSLQDSQATSALALINPDSPALSTNYARLSQMYKSPTTTQEDKAKLQREIQDVMEYQKVGRDITKAGNVLNYTYKGKNATVALKVEEMKISAQKEMDRLAEKAANDAEKWQTKYDTFEASASDKVYMTTTMENQLKRMGIDPETYAAQNDLIRGNGDADIIDRLNTNTDGLNTVSSAYRYGSKAYHHIFEVYGSVHNMGANTQNALIAISGKHSEMVQNYENMALYSQTLGDPNSGLDATAKKGKRLLASSTVGVSPTTLSIDQLYALAGGRVLQRDYPKGVDIYEDKGYAFNKKVLEEAERLKSQIKTKTYQDQIVAKRLSKNMQGLVPIKSSLIPNTNIKLGVNPYTNIAAQPVAILGILNVADKTAQQLGVKLTWTSGMRDNRWTAGSNHKADSVAKGLYAVDYSAGSSPTSTGRQYENEQAQIVKTFYAGMTAFTGLGTGTIIRGGGSDFDRLNEMASYVKKYNRLPKGGIYGKSSLEGYESMSQAEQNQLFTWLKNGTFKREGVKAQNHIHFEGMIDPTKLYKHLPRETRQNLNLDAGGTR